MPGKVKESSRHVEAVLCALDILECFDVEPELPLRRITELSGLNKSRVIRLCGTLVARGYLSYDAETGKHALGPRVLRLSQIYERSHTLVTLARPVLRGLARRTGESATLFVVDGTMRLCIAREEGTHSIRYNIVEGQRNVLYAGSGGKVLLAFGTDALRRRVVRKDALKKLTPNTIDSPDRLTRELSAVRRHGYAASAGERDSEVASLAAPIFDRYGNVCAALTIAGPVHRFSRAHNATHLTVLLASARRISRLLGYGGESPASKSTGGNGAS